MLSLLFTAFRNISSRLDSIFLCTIFSHLLPFVVSCIFCSVCYSLHFATYPPIRRVLHIIFISLPLHVFILPLHLPFSFIFALLCVRVDLRLMHYSLHLFLTHFVVSLIRYMIYVLLFFHLPFSLTSAHLGFVCLSLIRYSLKLSRHFVIRLFFINLFTIGKIFFFSYSIFPVFHLNLNLIICKCKSISNLIMFVIRLNLIILLSAKINSSLIHFFPVFFIFKSSVFILFTSHHFISTL